jgi:hypothetical protein
MRKRVEGGAVGTAQNKSYTRWLIIAAMLGFGYFVNLDVKEGGARLLPAALNIDSTGWMWFFLFIALWLATGIPAGVVSVTYTQHTGVVYTEDRLGYAKSGGSDISFWCGFAAFLGVVFVFSKYVPRGVLGGFRPFAVLLLATGAGCLLARLLARMVFSALYGPPEHKAF